VNFGWNFVKKRAAGSRPFRDSSATFRRAKPAARAFPGQVKPEFLENQFPHFSMKAPEFAIRLLRVGMEFVNMRRLHIGEVCVVMATVIGATCHRILLVMNTLDMHQSGVDSVSFGRFKFPWRRTTN
jgi:hypothetical protein